MAEIFEWPHRKSGAVRTPGSLWHRPFLRRSVPLTLLLYVSLYPSEALFLSGYRVHLLLLVLLDQPEL